MDAKVGEYTPEILDEKLLQEAPLYANLYDEVVKTSFEYNFVRQYAGSTLGGAIPDNIDPVAALAAPVQPKEVYEQPPDGQPLPGVIATLLVGGSAIFCRRVNRKRKKQQQKLY